MRVAIYSRVSTQDQSTIPLQIKRCREYAKCRLEKMSVVSPTAITQEPWKKIQRSGPTRPWQENLPKYQNPVDKSENSAIAETVKEVAKSEAKVEPKLSDLLTYA